MRNKLAECSIHFFSKSVFFVKKKVLPQMRSNLFCLKDNCNIFCPFNFYARGASAIVFFETPKTEQIANKPPTNRHFFGKSPILRISRQRDMQTGG
jgi:hypothetical protein